MGILLAQAQPGGGGSLLGLLVPFGLMFLLLYFIMIRPQKKKEQERMAMLNSLRKNDHVITGGGIYGVITAMKDKDVTLKIDDDNNVKIRVAKSAIVGIEKRAEE